MIDRILQAYARSNYDFRTTAKPGDTLAHLFEKWVPYYRMKAAVAEARIADIRHEAGGRDLEKPGLVGAEERVVGVGQRDVP